MTYRNDHDAALARVDALERELEQMAGEYEKVRSAQVAPASRPRLSAGSAFTRFLIVGFGVATAAMGYVAYTDTRVVDEPVAAAAPAIESLASCLRDVEASTSLATDLDARTTDPRGGDRRSVDIIARIGAACRPELLRASQSDALDPETRTLLQSWSQSEDELVGASTRLLVYYGSDPYSLDRYATAGQVWRELDAARVSRDTLVSTHRTALRRAVAAL